MDDAPSFTLCFSLEDIHRDDHSELTESTPPFTVCFSPEDVHRDDPSELTGSFDDVDGLSHEDDSGIERAADPSCCRTLDGSHVSDNENEELAKIRRQLLRAREEIHVLSSKLSQCEVDIEALRAERSALVNELAAPSTEKKPPQEQFSKAGDDGDGGGGFRHTNAELFAENSRLRAEVDILRKSSRSYIEDSRRIHAEDGQEISDLRRENELLRQHLYGRLSTSSPVNPVIVSTFKSTDFTERNPSEGKRALSGSERTAGTCPLDASDVTLPQLGVSLSALRSMALSESHRPASDPNESAEEVDDDLPSGDAQPLGQDRSDFIRVLRVPDDKPMNERPAVKEVTFGEGPIKTRSEDGESTAASAAGAYGPRGEFRELAVDFGKARGTKFAIERWNGLPDEAARKNAGGMLVDFGETRRPERTPRRRQSFIRKFLLGGEKHYN